MKIKIVHHMSYWNVYYIYLVFYSLYYICIVELFQVQQKDYLYIRRMNLESYRIFRNLENITLLLWMEIETADAYQQWIELGFDPSWMLGSCMHKRPIQVRQQR